MDKLFNRIKLLFAVITIQALLPASNLLAYEWDEDFTRIDNWTSDYASDSSSHYAWIVDCEKEDVDIEDTYGEGFTVDGDISTLTDVDIWSFYNAYSDEIEIEAYTEIGGQKDWEWNGPGAAPGAVVDLYIVFWMTAINSSALNGLAKYPFAPASETWPILASSDSVETINTGMLPKRLSFFIDFNTSNPFTTGMFQSRITSATSSEFFSRSSKAICPLPACNVSCPNDATDFSMIFLITAESSATMIFINEPPLTGE